MRTLSASLLAAQKAGALNPLSKIVLTKGASSYTYEQDRILPSKHDEEMYSHVAEVVLHNRDHALDDIDFQGYDVVISYGFGSEYSDTASLSVIDQQFNSDPDNLTCTLFLEGIPNLMARDEANDNYIPDEDDETTVKDLIDAIAGATLDCFGHCEAFEVVWDDGYDALADTYKPKDGFRIYTDGNRLAAFRKALDYTANVPRFEDDGKIHIMKPVTTGTDYDSEYSLAKGSHTFFKKAYRNTLVIPNKIYVKSYADDDPQYLGSAQIDGYNDLPDRVKKIHYVQAKLESNAQAEDIAEALIVKAEMGSAQGSAEIRINIGAEMFDYVKVTDSRQGDTRTGNIGYIHRRFGGDTWKMTFGFGNWFDQLKYQKILKQLETYTDAGNYFSRLQVGDLYAEHILADSLDMVWIDPDGNIDLSQIGDTLDHLADGEVYGRVKTLHLDNGQVKLDEYIYYAPGYNPLDKFDLNTDDLDDIPDGETFQRVKTAALTAEGLVILDQVVVGTYGLTLATDIEAGHILLSKTVKDGLWYDESGVVLDATYGIALYGGEGINAFRTFATKEDYEAGTPVQVYIGTDGKLYAGGGKSIIDVDGITVEDGYLKFVFSDNWDHRATLRVTGDWLEIKSEILGVGTHDIYLNSGDVHLREGSSFLPETDGQGNVGHTSKQFYGGYFASRLKIPVGTDMYD